MSAAGFLPCPFLFLSLANLYKSIHLWFVVGWRKGESSCRQRVAVNSPFIIPCSLFPISFSFPFPVSRERWESTGKDKGEGKLNECCRMAVATLPEDEGSVKPTTTPFNGMCPLVSQTSSPSHVFLPRGWWRKDWGIRDERTERKGMPGELFSKDKSKF